MATQKQIEANRKNAKQSTGPKTSEGKAVASKNSLKDGLHASDAVIGTENLVEFNHHSELIIEELAPVGPMESILAQRIITLSWRLKRTDRIQNQTIDALNPLYDPEADSWDKEEIQAVDDPARPDLNLILGRIAKKDFSCDRVLDRLQMYERRIERSFHKAILEFQRLQNIRIIKNNHDQKTKFEKTNPILISENNPNLLQTKHL